MLQLVGRDTEKRGLLDGLARAAEGPVAVLIEGEAGMGKTSLWKMALNEAEHRELRILTTHVAEFETGLSFVGLSDLLAEVTDAEIAGLPAVQQGALDAALLRSDGPSLETDWRAVAAGALGLMRSYAATGPLVVGIDDVQWLDQASANVLATALRRLESEPVFVVMTRRASSTPGPFDPTALFGHDLEVIEVDGLDWTQVEQVIRERLGRRFDPATVKRIHETSGGNPFYALEIARSLGATDLSRGDNLPIPKTLSKVISNRLGDLSDAALQVLLVVAAASQPTVSLVEQTLGEGAATDGVAEARRADIIETRDEMLRFTHPLFASTIYEETSDKDRKALHDRLSQLIDDVEQRASHLARARSAPDAEVARALDEAAIVAKARGAIERATQLAWRAVDFTPVTSVVERADRSATAAEHEILFGDRARLEAVLKEALDDQPPGCAKARMWILYSEYGEHMRVIAGLTEALDGVADDPVLTARLLIHRARPFMLSGDLEAADRDAREAIRIARDVGDRHLLALALSQLGCQQVLQGHPEAARTVAEAISMPEASEMAVYDQPLIWQGCYEDSRDDLDAARAIFEDLMKMADERGDLRSYSAICFHLLLTECRAARFARADELAAEITLLDADLVEDQVNAIALLCRGLVDVHLGHLERARLSAERGARITERDGDVTFLILNRWVLGLVGLAEGDYAGAARHLRGLPEMAKKVGMLDPNRLIFDGDLIEALIGAGHLDEAGVHLDDLQTRAEKRSRVRALAIGARCRGMLADQRGDHGAALVAFDESLEFHAKIPDQPFELARTLLAKGIGERRAKQRGAARESLGRARKIFVDLGTTPWIEKTEVEAKRIGGRAPATDALTPTEEQVADLVAEGLSNRDVADRLFLSIKTVEANLSRTYRKLDVKSRTQLAQKLRASN